VYSNPLWVKIALQAFLRSSPFRPSCSLSFFVSGLFVLFLTFFSWSYNFFRCLWRIFLFWAVKLCHFIINDFFSMCNKHATLTTKIRKQGKIGCWLTSYFPISPPLVEIAAKQTIFFFHFFKAKNKQKTSIKIFAVFCFFHERERERERESKKIYLNYSDHISWTSQRCLNFSLFCPNPEKRKKWNFLNHINLSI